MATVSEASLRAEFKRALDLMQRKHEFNPPKFEVISRTEFERRNREAGANLEGYVPTAYYHPAFHAIEAIIEKIPEDRPQRVFIMMHETGHAIEFGINPNLIPPNPFGQVSESLHVSRIICEGMADALAYDAADGNNYLKPFVKGLISDRENELRKIKSIIGYERNNLVCFARQVASERFYRHILGHQFWADNRRVGYRTAIESPAANFEELLAPGVYKTRLRKEGKISFMASLL